MDVVRHFVDTEGPLETHAAVPRRPRVAATMGALLLAGLMLLLWRAMQVQSSGDSGLTPVPFKQAPAFTLGLFDGGTLTLADAQATGKPVVLNFWASWCVPCMEEAPVLQRASQQHPAVSFIGINVQDIDTDARNFIRKYGISYPNGAGNGGEISVSYGMRGIPETFFIATDGRVVSKWNGALSAATLDRLIAEMRSAGGRLGS